MRSGALEAVSEPLRIPLVTGRRFIVAQNRAAVSVEHPVPLLLHLEALVGTDVFQQRIEEVSKELSASRTGADDTAAAMERWVVATSYIIYRHRSPGNNLEVYILEGVVEPSSPPVMVAQLEVIGSIYQAVVTMPTDGILMGVAPATLGMWGRACKCVIVGRQLTIDSILPAIF